MTISLLQAQAERELAALRKQIEELNEQKALIDKISSSALYSLHHDRTGEDTTAPRTNERERRRRTKRPGGRQHKPKGEDSDNCLSADGI
jgi:hypothetical protein